jgi:hypothetical protein
MRARRAPEAIEVNRRYLTNLMTGLLARLGRILRQCVCVSHVHEVSSSIARQPLRILTEIENQDYLLFSSSTHQSAIWYLSGPTRIATAWGPMITAGYNLMGAADLDGNGKPDYVLYNSSTRQTAICYMNNSVRISAAYSPTLPLGWNLAVP